MTNEEVVKGFIENVLNHNQIQDLDNYVASNYHNFNTLQIEVA